MVEAAPAPAPARPGAQYLVVPQEEGQQHEHPSIVHDPPDIDVALREALLVAREHGHVLGYQQGQVPGRGLPHQLWGKASCQPAPLAAAPRGTRPARTALPMKFLQV